MPGTCAFIPPYLMARIATARPEQADRWQAYLRRDEALRSQRTLVRPPPRSAVGAAWIVHSADNTATLPGRVIRSAGEPESGDAAVDEAAHGVEASLALFRDVYQRASYDAAGAPVSVTVHYEQSYANAFWDGTQLVFGDGDGEIFDRFTKAVDVLGHEFAHAVIEHSAGLVYRGQSGALNESVADVFAVCLEQRLLGQTAEEGDWLIGAELFLPGVEARALRDMARPGTAYDDAILGRDPQPAHMDDFVVTTDDNGGVHINSGIPNRAFHLAAVAIGGIAAEGAGRIWYAALTGGDVGPTTDFAGFAAATVAAAGEHAAAVRQAWQEVGVATDGSGTPADGAPETTPRAPREVVVRRQGGILGRPVEWRVDLDSADDARAAELAGLLDQVRLPQPALHAAPQPDRFVYEFDLCGRRAEVPEQELTDDLRRVIGLVQGG